jgi:secreted PhoX family phosphatase
LGPFFGLGGWEGIHPDDNGNIYLQEDIGGRTAPPNTLATVDGLPNVPMRNARQPNSFVYRYVPNNPRRLEDGGKLQALQVTIDGSPVTFHAADVIADIVAPAQRKLHTLGTTWPVKWITIHESKAGDTTPFVATTAAKAAGATPFKRPENMAWLPGSKFRTFFFGPTGDTDAPTGQVPQLAARGAWGSIFRVDLRDDDRPGDNDRKGKKPPGDDGTISIFVIGDEEHNSFDNLAFANDRQLLAAEDRGDPLHQQLQKFDSVWAFDVKTGKAVRFIALGRDASSAAAGNDDNEPTGVFVSSGSAREEELLGTEDSLDDARGFFTQQHGDCNVFEFFRAAKKSS